MELWKHQAEAIEQVEQAISKGEKRICVTSPTGGGKSLMQREIIKRHRSCAVYTNRKMLFEQLSKGLTDDGIEHGKLAADYDWDMSKAVQLCMIPTVHNKMASRHFEVPPSEVVIIDECHTDTKLRISEIMDSHAEYGSVVIGFSATPAGIGHLYDVLITAGTNSDLRSCGAHVPAMTYAPSEIDTKKLKSVSDSLGYEYKSKRYRHAVHGNILKHYRELNPGKTPTLIFSPGVRESKWVAEFLTEEGERCAHIDGETIWLDGEEFNSTQDSRSELLKMVAQGELILSNRFVLREGIDIPELQCCILATRFSSVVSYVQATGRLIRKHPSHKEVTLIDMAGNWWHHGSINQNREWDLNSTPNQMAGERFTKKRAEREDGVPPEIICPKCGQVRISGNTCRNCGYVCAKGSRMILQSNGELKRATGDPFAPRKRDKNPQNVKDWKKCYFGGKNRGASFNQAIAWYAKNHHWCYPQPDWPYMPKNPLDATLKISQVGYDRLHEDVRAIQ